MINIKESSLNYIPLGLDLGLPGRWEHFNHYANGHLQGNCNKRLILKGILDKTCKQKTNNRMLC